MKKKLNTKNKKVVPKIVKKLTNIKFKETGQLADHEKRLKILEKKISRLLK